MKNDIGFISLGCAKATYDIEQLLTSIAANGYQISSNYHQTDLVIINTCGFIEDAVNESLEAIGEAVKQCSKVIVTGCLGAKKSLINNKYPDLLAITPPNSNNLILSILHKHLPLDTPFDNLILQNHENCKIKLTPKHYAWLKIAEGCNQQCSFCIIPSMRGKLSSRTISSVLQEAENLVKTGVKELLIVAQDTVAYGVDMRYQKEIIGNKVITSDIVSLTRELGKLGIWVRLHYLYPYPKLDNLVELMAEGSILPYLDVPLQHASHTILTKMHRPANTANIQKRIQYWRDICPDIHLRTTMIVGFPGETEQHFEQLCDFIKDIKFDRLGVFVYSDVKRASSNNLTNHVDLETKILRQEILMNLQQTISFNKLKARIGAIETVMVDELYQDGIIARSKYDAPEVDGVVHIHTKNQTLDLGDFTKVRIIANDFHDLEAELLQ